MTWEKHRQTAGIVLFGGLLLIGASIAAASAEWLRSSVALGLLGSAGVAYGCLIELIDSETRDSDPKNRNKCSP